MNRKLKKAIIVSLALAFFLGSPGYSKDINASQPTNYQQNYVTLDFPYLQQDPIHETVARRVTNYFTQFHYRDFELDEAFSKRIFDRYLKLLDFNKSLFTAEDISKLSQQNSVLGKELKTGKLTVAFAIYNQALEKRFTRYQYALSVLERPLNFSSDEIIDFDREKLAWPRSEKELDQFWIKKVKFDALNLALANKKEDEIKQTLTKRYRQVLKILAQSHSEDAFQIFMNAFAKEIDPHTTYLAPRRKRDFDSDLSLSFEGIGATLVMEEDYTTVVSLIPGGPAEKSHQINIGDKIIGVGGKEKSIEDVIGWRLDDIVDLIRGPKGTKVQLEVVSAAKNAKPRIVEIKRGTVRLEDREVKSSIFKTPRGTVGTLEIPSFYIGLTAKTQGLLDELIKQNVDTIVIDLRSNGGGSLEEVISLTGLFIPSGPVVQVRDNLQNITQHNHNKRGAYFTGPIVVLVNRYSASASEIFSAALQDYRRAVIVGETTFGKGTVQSSRNIAHPIDEKIHPDWPQLGGIQYTTQKFYRINGGSTQLKGVEPDIQMVNAQFDYQVGERYMDNALPWDSIVPVKYKSIGNVSAILPYLRKAHEKRIAVNPEFNYIEEDIRKLNKRKNAQYQLSLNLTLREEQLKDENDTELKRTNERLQRMGLPPIKQLEKLPKNYKVPDAFCDEAKQIALDLKHYYVHRS